MNTYDSVPSEISFRDVACFTFAIAIHSLLLLWKGGLLTLPEEQKLGDMIVAVDFRSEVPTWDAAPSGGAAKQAGLLARVKSIFKRPTAEEKKADLAMGQRQPINAEAPAWNKTSETLNNKAFNKDKFKDLASKKDNVDIAVGQNKQIEEMSAPGTFKNSEPNLKQNKFRVAKRDMPFAIVSPKNQDALQNVNAIPMPVGRVTTPGVRSLEGNGTGSALQSKSFGSNSSFGGTSKGSSGALAMGSSSGSGQVAGASFPGSMTGTASGTRSGGQVGGSDQGRAWAGGNGSSTLVPLGRNTFAGDGAPSGIKSTGGQGFEITGALRGRGIVQKIQPAYEMDARVALRFRVGWDGRVLDGIVVEVSSGSPSFDQKVLNALKKWIFVRLPDNRTNEIQEGLIKFVFKGV